VPYDAVEDLSGLIWFGGNGSGLALVDPIRKKIKLFSRQNNNPLSLASDHINTLFVDRDNNIWIGTDHGLSICNRSQNGILWLRQIQGSNMTSNRIAALAQDYNNRLWIGYEEEGIDTVSLQNMVFGNLKYSILTDKLPLNTFIRERANLSRYAAHGAIKSNKGQTIQTFPDSYAKFQNSHLSFKPMNENRVSSITLLSNGDLVIGLIGAGGFNIWNHNEGHFERYALWGLRPKNLYTLFSGDPFGANWYGGFVEDNLNHNLLWCTTWETLGLNCFNRALKSFDPIHFFGANRLNHPVNTLINNITDKKLWLIGHDMLGYFDFNDSTVHRFAGNLPQKIPFKNDLDKYYPSFKAHLIPDFPIHLRYEAALLHHKELWIATSGGLLHFIPKSKAFQLYRFNPSSGYQDLDSLYSITLSPSQDELLLNSAGGMLSFNLKKLSFTRFPNDRLSKEITAFTIHKNMIFYTTGSSIYSCTPQGLDNRKVEGIPNRGLLRWIEGGCGDDFIISSDQWMMICRFDSSKHYATTWKVIPAPMAPSSIRRVVRGASDGWWISGRQGLLRIDEKGILYKTQTHLLSHEVDEDCWGLVEEPSGKLWVSTASGIKRLSQQGDNRKLEVLPPYPSDGLSSRLCTVIAQDQKNNLWVGTSDAGLNYVDLTNSKVSHFGYPGTQDSMICGINITAIYCHKEITWVGSEIGLRGLIRDAMGRIKGIRGAFLRCSGAVKAIVSDMAGNIWFVNGTELYCYLPAKDILHRIPVTATIKGALFSSSVVRLQSGMIGFGGSFGVVLFDPGQVLKSLRKEVKLRYEELRIDDEEVYFSPYRPLKRLYQTTGSKGFSVRAIVSKPLLVKEIALRYRLKGFEEGWHDLISPTFLITYGRLEEGNYQLEIEFDDHSGSGFLPLEKIAVEVDPPWYLWKVSLLMWCAILVLLVVFIVKRREVRLKRQNAMLEEVVSHRTAELQEANRELRAGRDQLKKMVESKNKFFSIISHDLKNPFRSIETLLTSMVQNWERIPDETRRDQLEKVSLASRSTNKLLDDLLLWSMTQRGDLPVKKEDIPLHPLVQDLFALFAEAAAGKSLSLRSRVRIEEVVYADYQMLSLILRNLIHNAIKFSKEGGEVIIDCRRGEGHIITVIDYGVGMKSEVVAAIFEQGMVVRRVGTKGEQGNGLGLKLCYEYVKRQGGDLEVRSQVGDGSEFIITLPKKSEEDGQSSDS
jgi:signal transduction histidine kinase/ligand-binding sensor domain-containing protein